MRRFISYLAFAFTLAVMVGCVKIDDITSDHQGMVTLKLSNNTLITTRATTSADEKALNEFWIDKVQCFFTTDDNTIVYASDLITIADDDKDGSANLNLTIPSAAMTTLFSGTGTPKIYVVANVGTKIEAETIADVKDQAITLEAYKADAKASAQSKFVMDSALTAIKKSDNSIVTSDGKAIDLIRAAAKIQVQVNINKIITVGEGDAAQTWTPVLDDIEMTYNRSVTSSKLNATADAATARASYAQTVADFTFAGTDEGSTATAYTLTQKVPFYSYPSSWTNTKDNEAYISLIIPWSKDNGASYLTYSYQIPVNFDGKKLERNHLYQLNVNVGVLGTLEGDVELTPSYVVVDWGTGAINTALSSPKYLVVDETVVNIYNQNQYDIVYASSHPVSAVITKITKPNYSQETESTVTIYNQSAGATTVTPASTISGNKESFTVSIVEGSKVVRLSHVLNNNNKSDGFDYVPYDITVVVTNEAGMSQTITYKQYPAMYVKAEKNPGQPYNSDRGYVYIYGSTNGGSSGSWDDMQDLSDGGNHNPNMYVITTTAMDVNSSFILGDARSEESVTGQSLGLSTAFNEKSLQYYYPSRTDNDNYVAPSFRIASSYGKCGQGMSYENAKKRCAAYQEQGFPAGRWRVPTTAEMKYIAMISRKGWIPHLFTGGRDYWTASEYITYSTTADPEESNTTITTNTTYTYVRCVYDEWYWGTDKCDEDEFTWGDQQK